MSIRTTSLCVLMLGAVVATTWAQGPADRTSTGKISTRANAMIQAAIARLQQPKLTRLTVAGQILMPDGSTVTHARLYVAMGTGRSAALDEVKIDTTGRFRHIIANGGSRLPDNLVISAVVPGKAVLWRRFASTDKTLGALSLRLDTGVTAAGRVVDLNGKPLSGIDVKIPRLGPGVFAVVAASAGRSAVPTTEFLPATVVSTLYHATTDSAGRFTLPGLPAMGQLHVTLGSGLMAAPGSVSPITLSDRGSVDAGTLVAVHPGSIALHVTDRSAGKPVADLQVVVLRKNQSLLDFSGMEDDPMAQVRLGGLPLNAKGELAVPGLAPGDYHVLIEGMDRLVTVTEAQTARVELAVRTGPLKGHVVDADGKPVAGVPITLDPVSDPRKDLLGGFGAFDPQRGAGGAIVTDAHGLFEMPQFPWEADAVTLHAKHGDDEAVWSGPARDIGKRLEMRLRGGALVTVTGRLVGPQQTLKKQTVSLIRWQDAPRITWLFNATQAVVDAQGRFKVVGLPRGEAFSMISGSSFMGGDASGQGFESPRFTTGTDAGVQDLGDIVVHPLDSGQQVLQIYGIDSREQLARLAALTSPPSGGSVEAARETLTRYRSALEAGDFDTVRRLTSRASQGWSEDPREFMAQSAFRPPSLDGAQPLRFVPGISLAYLLALGKASASPVNFNFGAATSDLQANPDWVVLANAGATTVRITGIAHREQGEWRVVNSSFAFGPGLESLFLVESPNSVSPNPAGFTHPAPAPESAQIDAARAVGENYLAAWSHDDDATQLRLTSALSTSNATSIAGLRRAKRQRIDEGVCPVSAAEEFHLQPVQGLTQWESEWLAGYAGKFDQIVGQQPTPNSAADARAGFPGKYVEHGELIPFAYHAGGHDFLMLMIKQAGHWQVLEPALPM